MRENAEWFRCMPFFCWKTNFQKIGTKFLQQTELNTTKEVTLMWFTFTFSKWNNLRPEIRKLQPYEKYKRGFFKLIEPDRVFHFNYLKRLKYLTGFPLNFSHL